MTWGHRRGFARCSTLWQTFSILENRRYPVPPQAMVSKNTWRGYIQAHPGYRLGEHLPHDVDEYPAGKGRMANDAGMAVSSDCRRPAATVL